MESDPTILTAPFDAVIDALSPGARITSVRALTGGVSAQVHAVRYIPGDSGGDPSDDSAAHQVVVRRRTASTAWGERLPMSVEYQLLHGLHQAGLAVPRPHLWWPPDTMVMEFVHGTAEPPIGAERQMALALARIHAQPLTLGAGLPEREDPVAQMGALLRQAPIADSIAAFTAAPHDTCLLHGDFWPANLLWRNGELVAIIDWEDAAVGDPLSDLACARVELSIALGEASCAAFTAHYLSATKRDATRLPLWDLYVASTALDSMAQWGLEPEALSHRQTVTRAFQARALAAVKAAASRMS